MTSGEDVNYRGTFGGGGGTGDLPLCARSLAVSFPMPVLAPVITTTFPFSLAVDLHTPPAMYLLEERTRRGATRDLQGQFSGYQAQSWGLAFSVLLSCLLALSQPLSYWVQNNWKDMGTFT